MKHSTHRSDRGSFSVTLAAAIGAVSLAAVTGAAALTTSAPQPTSAPVAQVASTSLTPSSDTLLAAKAAPVTVVEQSAPVTKQATAPEAAAAAASGPGAGCTYGYRVSTPGVWVDDQEGQQHMSIEFIAGLSPLPEAAALQEPNIIDCPQYDEIHDAFIAYLVGNGDAEGAYVNEKRYRDGAKPFRVPVHTPSPYDPQVPGATTIARIEHDGQTPREVADGIDAWMAQVYPGAVRDCVMLYGYGNEPAVITGTCWRGYP